MIVSHYSSNIGVREGKIQLNKNKGQTKVGLEAQELVTETAFPNWIILQ